MMYVRKEILQWFVMGFMLVMAIFFSVKLLEYTEITWDDLIGVRAPQGQCGPPCSRKQFSFKIISGATSAVGPKICFNGQIVMGGKTKLFGPGLNIAVVSGVTGDLISADAFDMWSGDVEPLVEYLKSIQNGSFVLIASFDDPATRLNDDARTLISQLGSSQISSLAFRDNWVFMGGKGIKSLKPLEKHLKNDKSMNKYEDWPEMLEMEGCVPRKQD